MNEIIKNIDSITVPYLSSKEILSLNSAQYVFYDHLPEEGLNYYRLKLMFDNSLEEYSPVISINHVFYNESNYLFTNTFYESIQLKVPFSGSKVSVVNSYGMEIYRNNNSNINTLVDLKNIASGSYYLCIEQEGQIYRKNILVKN